MMKLKKIVSFLVSIFMLTACGTKKESIQPEVKDITESVYASGLIKSKNQYEVFTRVNGIIKTIFVKEGDSVKKGDPIFEIDNSSARLSTENARLAAATSDFTANIDKLHEADNAIRLARKKLTTDSLLWVRQKNLWSANVGTQVELEQRELNFLNSKNSLAVAVVRYDDLQRQLKLASGQSKNNLNISKTMEDDLVIRSDVDGTIYKIDKEQGELVTSQIPVAVIGASAEFIMELNIDEHDIVHVQPGQQVLVRMDSYKAQVFEGTVTRIDPMMNERTRTFKAEAKFVQKPPVLYPGLTVESNIVINTRKNALTIPRNYLVNDSSVMLKNGDLQIIQTGLMDYNVVEVTSGITSATKIIRPTQ